MNDFWAENLHEASLDGVEFPVASMKRTGGRAKPRHRYPHRDGQDLEDMGREPYQWQLEVPLFRGVSASHYPDTYTALRHVLEGGDDKLGDVEFVDPELGPLPVSIVQHTWTASSDKRNGGVFQIMLEEQSFEPFLLAIGNNFDAFSAAIKHAEFVDGELVGTGLTEADLTGAWADAGVAVDFEFPEGELFVSSVDAFFEGLDSAALAADEVAARIDRYRSRLDRVLAFDAMQEAERWSIVTSIRLLGDSVSAAGDRAMNDAPTLITFEVPSAMSHFEIALLLYGDRSRATEVADRNPVRNPLFYPPRAVLRVLSR